ncbi:MAG: zincin-like metallopeptidase domain-containing protein [Synechococcaceae cyanobacterium]|jgi:antirestriction protein ArdC
MANPRPFGASGRPSPEERLVQSLISLMENGTTPWRREWDAAAGGHHVHLLSGRPYGGSNPVLLTLGMHLRGSCLPWWCGFAEARARGLHPRRGSRAVHVLRPMRSSQPAEETGSERLPSDASPEGSRQGESQQSAMPRNGSPAPLRFRPVAVFNAADLEGPALAALIAERRRAAQQGERSAPERLAAAERVLGAWPVPVRHGGDQACYLPLADRIQLPERSAFHSAAALYATWAHEAIHSTGHPSRLGRDLGGCLTGSAEQQRAYAREELVAELGAVLVGDRLEIGSAAMNHAAYLQHWVALLQQSPRLLMQILGEARRAADLVAPESALWPREFNGGAESGNSTQTSGT